MKKLFLAMAVLALTGCATTAPINSYRAAGQQEAWQISGEFNHASNNIVIFVDGKKVIDDSLGFFGGAQEFTGTYQGKTINASCGYISRAWSRAMECMVFVGNERATTLRF